MPGKYSLSHFGDTGGSLIFWVRVVSAMVCKSSDLPFLVEDIYVSILEFKFRYFLAIKAGNVYLLSHGTLVLGHSHYIVREPVHAVPRGSPNGEVLVKSPPILG